MRYYIAMWASLIITMIHVCAEDTLSNLVFGGIWLVMAIVYGYLAIKDEIYESH